MIEPDGQRCYSFCNKTTNGGRLSEDCCGYGPEEYFLPRADILDGVSTVRAPCP